MAHVCPGLLCLVCVGAVPPPPPQPPLEPEEPKSGYVLTMRDTGLSLATCNICSRIFHCKRTDIRNRIEQHMAVHDESRPWRCFVCENAFKKKHHLQRHMTRHANGFKQKASTFAGASGPLPPAPRG
jgi:hypothetical protein